MKRFLPLLLALMLLLCACGNGLGGDGKLYVLTEMNVYTADNVPYSRTEYTYDELAQLVEQTFYGPEMNPVWNEEMGVFEAEILGVQSEPAYVNEYTYQNTLLASDYGIYGNNQTYTYEYGDQDKPQKFATCSMVYDEAGNLIRVETEERLCAAYEYDDQGRLSREYNYGREYSARADYFYEGDRLVRREIYRGGSTYLVADPQFNLDRTWTYGYDNKGRLTEKICLDGFSGAESFSVRYTYDSQGHIRSYADGYTQGQCECDANGNLIKMTLEDGSRIEYTYQTMEVPAEYAQAYRIWFYIRNYDALNDGVIYSQLPYYPMIPNPLWEIEPVIPQ